MSARLRGMLGAVVLVLALPLAAGAQTPEPIPLNPDTLKAAERLFDLPAYRQIATRQLYRALESLPEAQYRASVEALKDPQVVQVLRGVIARSMAQTYSLKELEFLARMLSTEEGQSIVAKEELLQGMLTRELLGAAVANPELARILGAP